MSEDFNNPYGTPEQNNTPDGSSYVPYEPENNEKGGKKGLAIASMVIGIIMIVLGCCFVCGAAISSALFMIIPIVIGILGAVLGIISISSKSGGKGMAITGIVLGIISVLFSAYMMISVMTLDNAVKSSDTGYNSFGEVFQALANGEISQDEYMEIITDASESMQ